MSICAKILTALCMTAILFAAPCRDVLASDAVDPQVQLALLMQTPEYQAALAAQQAQLQALAAQQAAQQAAILAAQQAAWNAQLQAAQQVYANAQYLHEHAIMQAYLLNATQFQQRCQYQAMINKMGLDYKNMLMTNYTDAQYDALRSFMGYNGL